MAAPTIRRHKPERTPSTMVVGSVCCSCCCCCCCCLHTLAGLAGAAIGSATAGRQKGAAFPSEPHRRGVATSVQVYWAAVVLVALLVLLISIVAGQVLWGIGIVVFGLPLLQLLASGIAFPISLLVARADARPSALRAMAHITVGSLAGVVVGGAAILAIVAIAKGLK